MNKYGFIQVTAASPKTEVGNPVANTNEVVKILEQCQDSDIVVFPELNITGYSLGDLFRQDVIYDSVFQEIERIKCYNKENSPKQLVFIGAPFRLENELFNCAVAINQGKVIGIVPKQNIPNYNEFYEARHFRSADGNEAKYVQILSQPNSVPFGVDLIFKFQDVAIMAEICEDLWMPIPPSSHSAIAGSQIAVNLSASNETVAKYEYRKMLVSSQSGKGMCGYVYASAGPTESTSDLVFGGHCLIAENGRILKESRRVGDGKPVLRDSHFITTEIDVQRLQNERQLTTSFGEAARYSTNQYRNVYVELEVREPKRLKRRYSGQPFVPQNENTLHNRCAEVFGIQVAGLAKRVERLRENPSLQIGVSGGLDSTLALMVAARTCDLLRLPATCIKGITMPGFGTTESTKKNALNLMEYLGIQSDIIDIRPACFQTFKDIEHKPFGIDPNGGDLSWFEDEISKITDEQRVAGDLKFENVQARQRTYLLMSRGFVLGTGDLSELAVGFCTYNADHMSMYNVNSSVPKTLVKFLVKYVAQHEYPKNSPVSETLLNIAETVISPELLPHKEGEIHQSTEDFLGPYELIDFYLFLMMRHGFSPKKIWYLAKNSDFSKEYSDDLKMKTLKTFITRFFSQQFKRNCMPDGPKVGSVSLSPRGDWRMPSDAESTIWMNELMEIENE